MNENLPSSVQLDANQNGTVSFATDVVATIAGLAATEVEGVASMSSGATSFADIFSRKGQNSKNLTKGVKVDIADNKVAVDVTIVVEYGSPVPDVAKGIQENVKKAVEMMSGLDVKSVDVHVQGVSFERENRAAQELKAQQQVLLEQQKKADLQTAKAKAEAEKEAAKANEKPADKPEEKPQEAPAEQPAEADDDEFELILDPDPEEEEQKKDAPEDAPAEDEAQ